MKLCLGWVLAFTILVLSWGSFAHAETNQTNNSVSTDFSVLEISEFLPNPFDNDDDNKPLGEWVELYNSGDEAINLNELIIKDEIDSHKLIISESKVIGDTIVQPRSYIIIYRDGDSDFSLNSDYDVIRLFTPENELVDSVSYSGSTEGMSYSKVNDDWYETEPTPGEKNIYLEKCDWQLEILMENSIFQDEFDFKLRAERNFGFVKDITVRGNIENYFGEIVKEYSPWTEQRVVSKTTKTYSPNLAEGIYQLNFWFENLSCDEADENNNFVSKLFAINPEYQLKENKLEIEKIYLGSDNKAEWGDQITVKVNIYKGEETKTAVELWAEKDGDVISKRSKINIYDEYQSYTLTLPLQLHPNCANEESDDGDVKLILEGFDQQVEETFKVEGTDEDVCKEYQSYIKKLQREEEKNRKDNAYQIIEAPTSIAPGEVFKVKVQIWSDKEHQFKLWSYLYRGSKCYSCSDGERESNLIDLKMKQNEVKVVDLLVKADDNLENGEYNLMVKINKDNQKTNKNLNQKIYVQGTKNEEITTMQTLAQPVAGENVEKTARGKIPESSGIVVYESNSEKARKLIPIFLALSFGLLCLVLIRKK